MRILIAHNRYQQSGGEDGVARAEAELLRTHGHQVDRLDLDNDHIRGGWTKAVAAAESMYSFRGRAKMAEAIARARPDVVHVHNFFPSFSPSIFSVCSRAGVPVVHTLHNYRIICAGATLYRDGGTCEDCLSRRSLLPGVEHRCYRGSRLGSLVSGSGMALHSALGTWEEVSAYIALTAFAAEKLGGWRLPREKIIVKPNFTADHGMGEGRGEYALFAGRLSPEKGIATLIAADERELLPMPVVVLGDGPMMAELTHAAVRPGSRLIVKGKQTHAQILDWMRDARVLVLPSLWYEGFPLVLLEAFSVGLPVLGANHGSIAELIEPGRTGALFTPGSAEDLSEALRGFTNTPLEMRKAARACYLNRYTPEANYRSLLAVYTKVTSGA